ncbi:isoamyl alcohol oxidase [Moniliophthora roreri MCA 2997]|uniref:Isoamyl alcohol oxidase n=2 Tax=Moniliophthora roreri TaxID=221103 RepID=V2YCD8_MONRO|nr:isoamyl alcohol oxidase [Moniliophthora roreri MCA 2997]KAI3597852.1 isoamyl alcohol oxidase [Moniliophthora roreri]
MRFPFNLDVSPLLPGALAGFFLNGLPGFPSGASAIPQASLELLNRTVEGRLFSGATLMSPCILNLNSSQCQEASSKYLDEIFRASVPGGYVNTQWETCQASGEQCLLDYTNTSDISPVLSPHGCKLGSVPNHFIDVRVAKDVQAGFAFAKEHNVPLVVKNSGHDYKGRSSAPGSLALWTHNLKDITYDTVFTPEGCSEQDHTYPAVSMGAGVQWQDAYTFAEAHNITLVGGSDRSVGAAGGWLLGGGHGMLANTMGLGADRALQFKIVTPDGNYLTANACQNQDLFFALRGGGGGTFGVVLESTVKASPQVTIQTAFVTFKTPNETLTKELWSTMTGNGLKWAKEGWGGIATSQIAIYINPKLSKEAAAQSMSPLIEFGKRVQKEHGDAAAVTSMTEFPSWAAYFEWFANTNRAAAGISLALGSRLINKENFETPVKQEALVSALLKASKLTPRLIIHSSTPFSYVPDGGTSVTEAWRSSLYHITLISPWNWNATIEDKRKAYANVSKAVGYLKALTPDAAYVNEADVYETNHEVTFWGSNYQRLLDIKRKYDPDQLLDCWQCVGWKSSSLQFSCYL